NRSKALADIRRLPPSRSRSAPPPPLRNAAAAERPDCILLNSAALPPTLLGDRPSPGHMTRPSMPKRRQQGSDPLDELQTTLPERVPVMPVKSTVLFPTGATGLQVGFAPNVEVLTEYRDRNLAVVLVHSVDDEM